ncbi:MAG: tRNA 2-thiouridine(34) synthase MnmA [Acidimicrobiales bacterium]
MSPGRVLVAMSGGVDSSVAAARLLAEGREVVGVTLKLWGGESDSGCCSVADVDDARRVAARLGIEHHVFNFGDDFDAHVVQPYVADHAAGRTPNPCIECNRHLKFDRLMRRADALGFDLVATGHHARVGVRADGTRRVARGADPAKDQSYVLHMLDQLTLARVSFPVGSLTKGDVRAEAAHLGLATADKPDSQDVCFITSTGGRRRFLGERLQPTPARVVDGDGTAIGAVPAIELVTIGQRHGLGLPGGGPPRYAVSIDVPSATVTVGPRAALLTTEVPLEGLTWAAGAVEGPLLAQASAHGAPRPCHVAGSTVVLHEPSRRVAPGQSVVLYEGAQVVGAGTAA